MKIVQERVGEPRAFRSGLDAQVNTVYWDSHLILYFTTEAAISVKTTPDPIKIYPNQYK